MLIDSKIHILNPTQKIQLCIKQHHSKVGTDAIVIVILMRQSDAGLMQSSFRTTEKTTPIKYLLDHKQLAISGLKKKKNLYPYLLYDASQSALYSEVRAFIRNLAIPITKSFQCTAAFAPYKVPQCTMKTTEHQWSLCSLNRNPEAQ